jgi:hypothetical protein
MSTPGKFMNGKAPQAFTSHKSERPYALPERESYKKLLHCLKPEKEVSYRVRRTDVRDLIAKN